jgi:hypothetical protein
MVLKRHPATDRAQPLISVHVLSVLRMVPRRGLDAPYHLGARGVSVGGQAGDPGAVFEVDASGVEIADGHASLAQLIKRDGQTMALANDGFRTTFDRSHDRDDRAGCADGR